MKSPSSSSRSRSREGTSACGCLSLQPETKNSDRSRDHLPLPFPLYGIPRGNSQRCVISCERPAAPASKGVIERREHSINFWMIPVRFVPKLQSSDQKMIACAKGGHPQPLTSHDHHPGPLHRNSSLALTAIIINIVKLVAQ